MFVCVSSHGGRVVYAGTLYGASHTLHNSILNTITKILSYMRGITDLYFMLPLPIYTINTINQILSYTRGITDLYFILMPRIK